MKTKYDINEVITGFEGNDIVKYRIDKIMTNADKSEYSGYIATRNPDGTWSKFCNSFSRSEERIAKAHNQYTPEFIMETFGIEVQAATVYFKDEKKVDDILVMVLERIHRLLLQEPDENTGCPTDGECVDDAVKYINEILGE